MKRRRPDNLEAKLTQTLMENDLKIRDAIAQLIANPKSKLNPDQVAKLAGVHANSVRNRAWAKEMLAVAKNQRQTSEASTPKAPPPGKIESLSPTAQAKLLKDLMQQNAILYEEVLGAHSEVKKRTREIEILKRRLELKKV